MSHLQQKTHPLLLPELLTLISGYLSLTLQQRCSLVCWSWHDYFTPLTWKSCTIDYEYHTTVAHIPATSLHTYASHIRTLSYFGFISEEHFEVPCTQLISLKLVDGSRLGFRGFTGSSQSNIWEKLARMVENNPNLTTIEMAEIDSTPIWEFWRAVARHKMIKHLTLDRVRIDTTHIQAFWEACAGLETLILHRCRFGQAYENLLFGNEIVFRRLEELHLDNILQPHPHEQIELLRMTPQLRSFYWRGEQSIGLPRNSLLSIIGSGRLPNLDSIDITGLDLGDLDIEHIIQCMSRVRKLAVYQTNLGPASMKSLQLHFKFIEDLNFGQCPFVTSPEIALILQSCPLLKHFRADSILLKDLREKEAWPCCENLRSLTLFFDIPSIDPVAESSKIFMLLSKLTQLRVLNLSRYQILHGQLNASSLFLRLDHGLGQLTSLRQLEEVYFSGLLQEMTMADAQWMERHWKALRKISGIYNGKQKDVQSDIKDFFTKTFNGHARAK